MRRSALFLVAGTVALLAACRRPPVAETARTSPPPAPSKGVVAEVEGDTVTAAELDERVGNRLARIRQEEYEIRRQALDEIVYDKLLAKEATRRSISVKELVADEVDNQVPEPDAKIVEGLYEQNRARLGKRTKDEALADIRKVLRDRARQERQDAFRRRLRDKAAVKIALEPPRTSVAVPASAPTLGPDGAPVTIVQFVDYQCPYCRRAQSTIDEIVGRYAGKVQLVHRDFPLDGHPQALPAARAARCAGEQGKFWDYHRSLMAVPGSMDEADLRARADALKLNSSAFSACLASGRFDPAIHASMDEGVRAGVNATPSYFVNGRMLSGALPFDEFREVVEAELRPGR